MKLIKQRLQGSLKAFSIHLGCSLGIAVIAAVTVFYFWYPEPYGSLLGGTALFTLIVCVDVICGPLLTLVLFNKRKPKKELLLDLSLVVAIQLAALGYGIYTMAIARPIYLAYELDRFRVVSQADIEPQAFADKPSHIPPAGWTGPKLIAVRVAQPDGADYLSQVELSVNGTETVHRPDRWDTYENQKSLAVKKSIAIEVLKKKHPDRADFVMAELKRLRLDSASTRWLPVQSRRSTGWVALIDSTTGTVRGFLPLDGF